MSYLYGLDPQASESLYQRAKNNPITPDSLGTYSLGDDLKTPFTGIASSAIDALMLGADASIPALKETVGRPIDDIFGSGTTAQDWLEGQRKLTHDAARYLMPDPVTTSVVGKAVHGLFEIGPQAIVGFLTGGPAGAAALPGILQGNKAMQLAHDKGMDPVTSMGIGAIEGATAAAGAVVPMHLAPAITAGLGAGARTVANIAAGATMQNAMGMTSRGATSALLEERGYHDMAQQYQVFDKEALWADTILGGAFGLLGHSMAARAERLGPDTKPPTVSRNDLDVALTANNAHHVEIDTTPGLPITPEARQAHVDAIRKAVSDLLAGDPVDVGAPPTLANFEANPHQTVARNEIADTLSAYLDVPTLELNMAGQVPRVEAQVPGAVMGTPSAIKIDGTYYPTKWALVDAGNVEATMSKADNQFRDRQRAASQTQIAKIAGDPDFNLLNHSPIMDFGAPTLTRDGQIIGGNGRFAGVSRAYDQGSGDLYKIPLQKNMATYGIDPAAAAGMKKPVLVRVVEADLNVKKAAMASNEGAGLKMSGLEQARVDSLRLGDLSSLKIGENGEILAGTNQTIIRQWMKAMPETEHGSISDSHGHLSSEGFTRLRNAVLHRAYGDSQVLGRLVESLDPGARNVANALVKAAPAAAEAKAAMEAGTMYPLDLTPDLVQAADTLERLRASGEKIADHLAQSEMFGPSLSMEARKILQFFGQHMRSAKTISDMINGYWAKVKNEGSPGQSDMLGTKHPEKAPLLDAAIAETRKTESGDSAELPFAQPNEKNTPQPTEQHDPYAVAQLLKERPNLTIANDAGEPVLARDALAQADDKITIAKLESKAYDVAVACALRG